LGRDWFCDKVSRQARGGNGLAQHVRKRAKSQVAREAEYFEPFNKTDSFTSELPSWTQSVDVTPETLSQSDIQQLLEMSRKRPVSEIDLHELYERARKEKVRGELWHLLGLLGMSGVAILLYAFTGQVRPDYLIIGFSFLVLAPAAYLLMKRKPGSARGAPDAPPGPTTDRPDPAFPVRAALAFGLFSALYWCGVLIAAIIILVIALKFIDLLQ